ncbi:hypothetical protein AMIS_2650 [Actinoplanes missouriensis 431]|uniref:Uncharacterized protein n=1 Tax=Actinoplanes missouriensis (strain ATCC 14538 / DSM 43046 / CBS 188.64 / JCM 3121 / NBRC 102363 / NCIMB 12654 / NRRL B-3342 / UNCC 431) TaxID=512565 RepID=I0GXJ8_ACTM4|nr:hypothetical protein AMIS_2650 [Actinoplanes missouriensis 431]
MIRHLTPGEKRTQAAAAAAVARAMARATRTPQEPEPADSWITPARARQIRHQIEETQC